ncbi:MAG: flagellar basal body rod protein FlgC [Pseudomonadota bacterium]
MTDSTLFSLAASALNAQSVRLNTIASNMANADVPASSAAEAFRARLPVFRAQPDASLGNLSRVEVAGIVESEAPARTRYQPDHPLANDEGYVFLPNVNLIEQMTDMISASRSYQANLEVMTTSKELMLQTLQLGQRG